jgi:acetyl-CoA carboxylase biotin carboxyl carrier protein
MDFELIERLMRMLEASNLNELDMTEGGLRIRLVKRRGASLGEAADVTNKVSQADDSAASETMLIPIKAGMAGAFYRAPAPGAAPFIDIGAHVAEGDQIAIIEAMKTLNPVEAECDGIIRAIHVSDGSGVEPGTLMFEIEKV